VTGQWSTFQREMTDIRIQDAFRWDLANSVRSPGYTPPADLVMPTAREDVSSIMHRVAYMGMSMICRQGGRIVKKSFTVRGY
jgi:hypothetical protein